MNLSNNSTLSALEIARYGRQITLPQVGLEGQRRLKASSVLLVGAGGLGSPAALYLAAAGVGRLGLVDFDRVDESNLHRQVLYGDGDVGAAKLEAAQRRLQALNPGIEVVPHAVRVTEENARELVRDYHVVVDGTDSFETRYVVNDACVAEGVPDVSASISQFEGQVSVYASRGGPCYRCIFAEPPPPDAVPSCAEGGVLGVLPGLLGVIQATETLKLLLGIGEPLVGRLLIADVLGMRFRTLTFDRDPECPACGVNRQAGVPLLPKNHCTPPPMPNVPEITVRELHDLRQRSEAPFLLDVRRPDEYEIANLGGALIPLDELPGRLGELESHRNDELIVVHCRSGARSARAVGMLRQQGFENAVNLKGGILAWSDEIDPSIQKY